LSLNRTQKQPCDNGSVPGIERITVVGAGSVGRVAARRAARGGFHTILEDISGQMIEPALAEIRAGLAGDDESFARIHPFTNIEDSVRSADLVIEAVPEDMETKLEIFTVLDKSAPPDVWLASTTSALSITEIASITLRSRRIFGLHFYNESLLGIVRGLETGDEAVAVAESVGKRMGLETIQVRDAAGFVIDRLRALECNEAFAIVQEGTSSFADVDKACRLGSGPAFGVQFVKKNTFTDRLGPFEWADAIGLDNVLQELERLQKVYGDRYRPNPLLAQHVKAGRTGRRTGRGVYQY
jgi:3-hydroxybutyryl-CoA dehydrogenase